MRKQDGEMMRTKETVLTAGLRLNNNTTVALKQFPSSREHFSRLFFNFKM
jgi:hypothetical protein